MFSNPVIAFKQIDRRKTKQQSKRMAAEVLQGSAELPQITSPILPSRYFDTYGKELFNLEEPILPADEPRVRQTRPDWVNPMRIPSEIELAREARRLVDQEMGLTLPGANNMQVQPPHAPTRPQFRQTHQPTYFDAPADLPIPQQAPATDQSSRGAPENVAPHFLQQAHPDHAPGQLHSSQQTSQQPQFVTMGSEQLQQQPMQYIMIGEDGQQYLVVDPAQGQAAPHPQQHAQQHEHVFQQIAQNQEQQQAVQQPQANAAALAAAAVQHAQQPPHQEAASRVPQQPAPTQALHELAPQEPIPQHHERASHAQQPTPHGGHEQHTQPANSTQNQQQQQPQSHAQQQSQAPAQAPQQPAPPAPQQHYIVVDETGHQFLVQAPDGHQFIVPEVHGLPDMEHVHTQYGAPPTVKQPDPEQSPDNKKPSPAEQPEEVGIKTYFTIRIS